jgi:NitT/TauT family transport system substrate-binding protein
MSGSQLFDPNSDPPAQALRHWERRDFMKDVAALTGASGLCLFNIRSAAAEPPPETTKIRLLHTPAMCLAPQYIAAELLRAEGFSEVEYVPYQKPAGTYTPLWLTGLIAESLVDFSMAGVVWWPPTIDSSAPVVVLAGIHAGCLELFGNSRVKSVLDLRGKTIAASEGEDERLFISVILSYVGIDPRKDVNWLMTPEWSEPMHRFVEGKADAFIGFPPVPQELRAKKIGHVILNTTIDRPWSQYFCCMVGGNREFVRKHPVATKKVLRAYLKATDICASDPNRAARYMVDQGHVKDFKYGLALLNELPYNRWRQSNPEDTLGFHALRLHEVGLLKSTPQKIIAQGTDWRFLNELMKRELKA